MGCFFVFHKATNILFFIKIFHYYLIFLTKKQIVIYFNNTYLRIFTINRIIIYKN